MVDFVESKLNKFDSKFLKKNDSFISKFPKMKFRIIWLLTVSVFFLASCDNRQENQTDPLALSLDSVMNSIADTARFNGNVLVSKNGTIVYRKSFGYANYDTKEQLNDSSLFELASVSKQFTAMAIMILKERGLISYDDDVKKYIPELPYEGMTIRHFLNHTSGIPDYEAEFNKGWDPNKIAFNDDMINLLVKNKPKVLFKPGEKWEYSNTAYALLASIIERISKNSYSGFLAENIFKPLHLNRTRVYNTRRSTTEIISNYAFGYVYSDSLKKFVLPDSLRALHFVYTLDGIVGDGTVNSTTGDLFLWDQSLYTEKAIKKTTLDEAFAPVKLYDGTFHEYGFGWGIAKDSVLGKFVHHSGGWPGYATYIRRYIDRNDCIIVLSNNGGKGLRSAVKEVEKRLKK
jgi:CubicO group peptidase (beta-lactamase class C family)